MQPFLNLRVRRAHGGPVRFQSKLPEKIILFPIGGRTALQNWICVFFYRKRKRVQIHCHSPARSFDKTLLEYPIPEKQLPSIGRILLLLDPAVFLRAKKAPGNSLSVIGNPLHITSHLNLFSEPSVRRYFRRTQGVTAGMRQVKNRFPKKPVRLFCPLPQDPHPHTQRTPHRKPAS